MWHTLCKTNMAGSKMDADWVDVFPTTAMAHPWTMLGKGKPSFPFLGQTAYFSGANLLFVVGKVRSDPTELSRLLRGDSGITVRLIVNRHETWGEASQKRTATQRRQYWVWIWKKTFNKKAENRWWFCWDVYWILGGGFKYFLCSSRILGKWLIHFDEHIFQVGWFNHQLG